MQLQDLARVSLRGVAVPRPSVATNDRDNMTGKYRNRAVQVVVLPEMEAWIQAKIDSGEYEKMSHVIRACVRKVMDMEGGKKNENE